MTKELSELIESLDENSNLIESLKLSFDALNQNVFNQSLMINYINNRLIAWAQGEETRNGLIIRKLEQMERLLVAKK